MLPTPATSAWPWPRIFLYFVILAIVYAMAQLGAVIAAAVVQTILVPGFKVEEWVGRAASDGVVVSAAVIGSAMLCVPLVWMLARRHEPAPWTFLGIRPVRAGVVIAACAGMAAFAAMTDSVNVFVLDRPLVPPFMTEAFASARVPALLFVAIVIVAPVTEELLFRGFLYGTLQSRGIRPLWCVLVTSVVFTVVHTQYDLHDITTVLLLALLLGAARARFDSIAPTIAMHALSNAIAFVETAIVTQ